MLDYRQYKQLILYFFVGLIATFVEWLFFYIFDVRCGLHYTLSTTLAFVFSTLANWGAGRLLVFKVGDAKGIVHEIISIYVVSCIGLLANLLIMWICVDKCGMPDMLSKILATAIVFIGNFAVRKFWIYRA